MAADSLQRAALLRATCRSRRRCRKAPLEPETMSVPSPRTLMVLTCLRPLGEWRRSGCRQRSGIERARVDRLLARSTCDPAGRLLRRRRVDPYLRTL